MAEVDFDEQDWQSSGSGQGGNVSPRNSGYSSYPSANNYPSNQNLSGNNSKMINLVLKTGIVKNPTQANYVLLGLALIFFGLMIYTFFSVSRGGKVPNGAMPPGMIVRPQDMTSP